MIKEKRRK